MSIDYVIVAGLGRCGTTAMMNLLWRGGAPCAGDPPAFEPPDVMDASLRGGFWARNKGKVIKAVDPGRFPIPDLGVTCPALIWLSRDRKEQAKSMAKLIADRTGDMTPHQYRAMINRTARGIKDDDQRERRLLLRQLGTPFFLHFTFEELLRKPGTVTQQIAHMVGPDWLPSPSAGASAIRQRSPECAPGLDLELELMREHEATL